MASKLQIEDRKMQGSGGSAQNGKVHQIISVDESSTEDEGDTAASTAASAAASAAAHVGASVMHSSRMLTGMNILIGKHRMNDVATVM